MTRYRPLFRQSSRAGDDWLQRGRGPDLLVGYLLLFALGVAMRLAQHPSPLLLALMPATTCAAAELAASVERIAVWSLLLASAVPWVVGHMSLRRWGSLRSATRLEMIAASCVFAVLPATWAFLESVTATTWLGSLEITAHAARYLFPIALLLLILRPASTPIPLATRKLIFRLASVGSAATFITHGCEALSQKPGFHRLILDSAAHLDWQPGSAAVVAAVTVIGIVDIAAACTLATRFRRFGWLYMIAWGLITALSRTTAFGWEGLAETLVRLPNAALPAIGLWVSSSQSNAVLPNQRIE